MILIRTFPKLFANMFGFVPYIGIWIKYLPQFIDITKSIIKLTEKGILEIQIKRDMVLINRAFSNTNRKEAANELRDIFRN